MTQINLLGQDGQGRSVAFASGAVYIVRLFAVLFIVLLFYWAFLFARTRISVTRAQETRDAIIRTQQEILASPERRELLGRQGQLRAANKLLVEHKYWSKFIPELARVTLRSASYIAFNADDSGGAHLTVTVPTYKDMDQFLQVFDLPQFSDRLGRIAVLSVGKYQQGEAQLIRFEIALRYDAEFLQNVLVAPDTGKSGVNSQ